MFARVSIYDIPEDRAHEAVQSFAGALDEIATARGFREAYFLLSQEAGRALALTLWVDHEGISASRVSASRLRGEAVRAVEGEVVSVDEYELALHIRPRNEAEPHVES